MTNLPAHGPATRPTFTPDARGHYPCPHPTCRQTFTRTQGVSRHWNQQHLATPPPDEDDEEFSPEVEAMFATVYGDSSDQDDEPIDYGTPGEADFDKDAYERAAAAYAERHREPQTLGQSLATAPATAGGVQLLPATACTVNVDAILALSDATSGLIDAITRLVHVGYDRTEARAIVLDLIDRLADQPAA